MKNIILVDGTNLFFRSYYATAYTGNFMTNSKGFPTNALFGFANMINKIILEEKPEYMIVAFDKGKTFRHEQYKEYKAGRSETPEELKAQMPLAKDLLDGLGIKHYEIDRYEADDIIGTFAAYCDGDSNYKGTIITSDKDMLQLVSGDVKIKLLKQKDYIRYDDKKFFEEYGILPKNIIDLKALQGDPSDNIPGVKGVGEKTALKLLHEYKTLDGIYENIDNIKGKLKEKLENDKEKAYLSYDLATIVRDVPMEIDIHDIEYHGKNHKKINELYEKLEFYSFLKKDEVDVDIKPLEYKVLENIDDLDINGPVGIYVELLGTNYHTSELLGLGLYNEDSSYFVKPDLINEVINKIKDNPKYTFDYKKVYTALKNIGVNITNVEFDALLAGYLLEYNVKEDAAYLANQFNYDIPFYESIYGKTRIKRPEDDKIIYLTMEKAKFTFDIYSKFTEEIEKTKLNDLYYNIEFPLALVLAKMEMEGIHVSMETLEKMGEEIEIKLDLLAKDIYNFAGTEFNISSPLQLGEILFEKLELPHGKKTKTGYSTAVDVLNKLKNKHPIIPAVMEYRILSKLHSTYIEGLKGNIMEDGKIHTIYQQAVARTGRLSSIEPNLQNIPIRYEYGRLIRKAFVPSEDSTLVSADYSQIELRILAHIANVESLKDAFNNDIDVHSKTAMDLFNLELQAVTKNQRRMAKAVNFGIIYGMSGYGLADNLGIPVKEASEFIENYKNTYPGIKKYMEESIKKAYETGITKTLFGRIRYVKELQNKNYMIRQQGERMALNTPIQGTSADIIKKAMIDMQNKFEELNLKSKMILQVHDELIFDVRNEELEDVLKIIKDIMENVYKLDVPLKVDIETGSNWYEAK